MNIYQTIRSKRKELGVTQDKLSKDLGISKGNLSRFENGHDHVFSYGVIVKICQYLGIESIPVEKEIKKF